MLESERVRCIDTKVIYKSISDAAKHTNCSKSHISLVCNGKLKTAKGLRFEFVDRVIKTNNPKKQKSWSNSPRYEEVEWKNQKEIYCYETETEYKSAGEASRDTGLSRSCILATCKANLTRSEDNLKSTSGHTFTFLE